MPTVVALLCLLVAGFFAGACGGRDDCETFKCSNNDRSFERCEICLAADGDEPTCTLSVEDEDFQCAYAADDERARAECRKEAEAFQSRLCTAP